MYLQNNYDGITTYFGSYDFGSDDLVSNDTIMFKDTLISGSYEKETSVKKNWDLFKDLGFKLDKVIEAPLAKKTKGSKESKGSYEEKRMSVIEGAHESDDSDYSFDINVTGSDDKEHDDHDKEHIIKDIVEDIALETMIFGADDHETMSSGFNDHDTMSSGFNDHDTMSFDFFGSHEESDDEFDPVAFMGSYDSDPDQDNDEFDFY